MRDSMKIFPMVSGQNTRPLVRGRMVTQIVGVLRTVGIVRLRRRQETPRFQRPPVEGEMR